MVSLFPDCPLESHDYPLARSFAEARQLPKRVADRIPDA
jgi:hypothetical protein